MGRDISGKQGSLRGRIAHLAARIMAEDGIDDFGYAKRKAARQAGARDARAMPDNQEIEQALAEYRAIYHKAEHEDLLTALRKQALTIMRMLERFNPHLTGAVLSGVAGRHSDIEIQLFVDSAKEVELFLLNQGIRYRATQSKLHVNRVEKLLPTFIVEQQGTPVQLTVLDRHDIRQSVRSSAMGRPIQRAALAGVEALLEG
jgi:hypothetical protein